MLNLQPVRSTHKIQLSHTHHWYIRRWNERRNHHTASTLHQHNSRSQVILHGFPFRSATAKGAPHSVKNTTPDRPACPPHQAKDGIGAKDLDPSADRRLGRGNPGALGRGSVNVTGVDDDPVISSSRLCCFSILHSPWLLVMAAMVKQWECDYG